MVGQFDLFKQNPASGSGPRTWIKICGTNAQRDIEVCAQLGVDALGFLIGQERLGANGRVQGHWLSVERAKALVELVPSQMSSVLLIHRTTTEDILALCHAICPDIIQVQKEISPQ